MQQKMGCLDPFFVVLFVLFWFVLFYSALLDSSASSTLLNIIRNVSGNHPFSNIPVIKPVAAGIRIIDIAHNHTGIALS
jgi:hypothetical protein